jgi:peptide/nickel transport system substrate-binding protein
MRRTIRLITLLLPALALQASELHFAMNGDPRTFDPLQVSENLSEMVRSLTGGVLIRVNRTTGQPEAELAESWKSAGDGKSIALRLRPGLKFSDGSPLTSADVARTLARALDPKEASPAGDPFRSDDAAPEISTPSALEVTLKYKSPKPGLEHLFDQLAIIPAKMAPLPATAGPYFAAEYKPGQYVRLQRNPNYWKRDKAGRQLPYIDSVRIDIQQNRDIEMTRFLRGELHLIPKLDPENFQRVSKEQPAAARNLGASLDTEFLWFNQAPSKTVPEWKRKWFTSAAFRHAMSLSIHRDDAARLAYRGLAHVAAGPFSPANKVWFNSSLQPLPFDAAAAQKQLAADGFRRQNGTLVDREGHAVEFSLITNSGNRTRERLAALVQSDLAKLGVKVNIVTLDFGSLIERITKTMDYEACLLGFNNVAIDPTEQMNVWLSSGPTHPWWPKQTTPATEWEKRIDALLLQQASTGNQAARKKAIDEVQRIGMEYEPILYLVNPDYLCAISPALKGVAPTAAPPQVLWNIEWLRLESN